MKFRRDVTYGLKRAFVALFLLLGIGVSASMSAAQGRDGPVVVELFTSQGCSACPSADAIMQELATRPGVIALALHVDYWDYIGWKDVFARPEHAQRQRGYAARGGQSMVYTPQMIINGRAEVVGNKAGAVDTLVATQAQVPAAVEVRVAREGRIVSIEAQGNLSGPVDVHLVRFEREESVTITRGENRGRTLDYANIVRDWTVLTQWDGRVPLDIRVRVQGDMPLAVLVQEPDHGPIVGAAALR